MTAMLARRLCLTAVVVAAILSAATPARAQLDLPATYAGDLPCADCPGIRYQLNLFPDQTFVMRMAYRERPGPSSFDSAGRWVRSTDGALLMLKTSKETTLLSLWGATSLRMLDRNGSEIKSNLNQDLTRGPLVPLDIPAANATSVPPLSNLPLVGTNWILRIVGDKAVPAAPDAARPAELTLDANGRAAGSDGCNRVSGTYTTKDSGLSFGAMAGTRMACPNMADRDRLFAAALSGTGRWRVTGDQLELMKPDGTRLALFVASPR